MDFFVNIMRYQRRFDLQKLDEMVDRLFEKLTYWTMIQIADMRRDKRLIAPRNADGIFESSADRQYRWSGTQ